MRGDLLIRENSAPVVLRRFAGESICKNFNFRKQGVVSLIVF